jgi:mono/diheme cytochrome c family protein
MKRTILLVFMILILAVFTFSTQPASPSQIARGKYLVEQVAMCIDCHSPRNERGEFIKEKWLQGGPLDLRPIHPIPNFADTAPSIVGVPPGWTEAEMIRLLETGIAPTGKPLKPPMPQYRMSRADAAAVVAYLKSLKKEAK